MKRLAIAAVLLAAFAVGMVLLARPGVQASPGATITVNDTGDTDARDGVITLSEAVLLATRLPELPEKVLKPCVRG